MATQPSPSAKAVIQAVWSGISGVFAGMPGLSFIGFSICLAYEAIVTIGSADQTLKDTLDATRQVLLIPYTVAIYRLLILEETTFHYDFAISTYRFQRLLAWTVGLWALLNIPARLPDLFEASEGMKAIIFLVLTVASIVVVLRTTILFPAIAIDAGEASLANALADSRGRFWFIFKAFFVTMMPWLAIAALAVWLGSQEAAIADGRYWHAAAGIVLDSCVEFLATVLAAVTASRLFVWIGDRLKGAGQGNPA